MQNTIYAYELFIKVIYNAFINAFKVLHYCIYIWIKYKYNKFGN